MKKIRNRLLASVYDLVNPKKAERLRSCAEYLTFCVRDGVKKLHRAYFCKVRLCPVCSWRRSQKLFFHTKNIMEAIQRERQGKPLGYLFLTLTVRNCRGEELGGLINQMMGAWNRLNYRKDFTAAVKGWYRGLEITHNTDVNSPDYDTYHPHFHCILAVNPSYFTNETYITQAKWTTLWQECLRANYTPIVDVRKVKGPTAKAVAEVAKYAVKDADYIIPDDWDLSVETVRVLDSALDHRRLAAFGGIFKEWHRKLNLDDEIDGDLVHTGDELSQDELDGMYPLITYVWGVGYNGKENYWRMAD